MAIEPLKAHLEHMFESGEHFGKPGRKRALGPRRRGVGGFQVPTHRLKPLSHHFRSNVGPSPSPAHTLSTISWVFAIPCRASRHRASGSKKAMYGCGMIGRYLL